MTTPLRLLTLALLASSALGLTNCKKDTEPEPDKRSQREIWLTSSGWVRLDITDVVTTPAGVVTTYVSLPSAYLSPCMVDDIARFNADRTFTIDDGPLQCQPPTTWSAMTWKFASNETEIVFDSVNKPPKITTLTATALALEYTEILSDGTSFVQTQTYTAK